MRCPRPPHPPTHPAPPPSRPPSLPPPLPPTPPPLPPFPAARTPPPAPPTWRPPHSSCTSPATRWGEHWRCWLLMRLDKPTQALRSSATRSAARGVSAAAWARYMRACVRAAIDPHSNSRAPASAEHGSSSILRPRTQTPTRAHTLTHARPDTPRARAHPPPCSWQPRVPARVRPRCPRHMVSGGWVGVRVSTPRTRCPALPAPPPTPPPPPTPHACAQVSRQRRGPGALGAALWVQALRGSGGDQPAGGSDRPPLAL